MEYAAAGMEGSTSAAGMKGSTSEATQQQDTQSVQTATPKESVNMETGQEGSSLPISKEKYSDELKKNLVKMGYNLATEMGCSIFIKLIDMDGISQYYGTRDLIQQYYSEGLKVDTKDVALNGKTGLPIETKKEPIENHISDDDDDFDNDDDMDIPSSSELPKDDESQGDEDQAEKQKRIAGIASALGGVKKSETGQSEDTAGQNTSPTDLADEVIDLSETTGNLPIKTENESVPEAASPTSPDNARRRKRKPEHPQKIKVKLAPRVRLPPKKRKIQVTLPVARKPVTRGRKPGVKNRHKKVDEKTPRKPRVKRVPPKVTEDAKKNTDGPVVAKPKEKRSHARAKKMQCKYCEKQFRDKWHLDRHERSHTGEKPFVCNTCGKAFSSSTHFKEHQMRHDGKRDWVCELCSRDFYFKGDLAEHVKKVHASGKGHTCSYCKKAFSQESQLKMHEEEHIKEEDKNLVCMICSKRFAYPVGYARHHRTEHGATSYQCPFCEKGHPTYANLKNHLTSHTGQRPFQCDQCGKTYASEGGLKWHLVIHGEGKSFACKDCDMKFFRKIDLTKHLTVHTTEKRYVCEFCGTQFKRIHSLNKHQQKHMGVVLRPYKCSDCGKAFDTAAHLKRHVSIHTGHKPFECQECKKCFNRKDNLRTHMKVHGYGSPDKAQGSAKIPRQKVKIPRPMEESDSESGEESFSESDSEGMPGPSIVQPQTFHSYAAPNEAPVYMPQPHPQPPQVQQAPIPINQDHSIIAEAVQSLRTIQWSHIS